MWFNWTIIKNEVEIEISARKIYFLETLDSMFSSKEKNFLMKKLQKNLENLKMLKIYITYDEDLNSFKIL